MVVQSAGTPEYHILFLCSTARLDQSLVAKLEGEVFVERPKRNCQISEFASELDKLGSESGLQEVEGFLVLILTLVGG